MATVFPWTILPCGIWDEAVGSSFPESGILVGIWAYEEAGPIAFLPVSASEKEAISGKRPDALTAMAFMSASLAYWGISTPRLIGDARVSSCTRSIASGGMTPVMIRYIVAASAYSSDHGP